MYDLEAREIRSDILVDAAVLGDMLDRILSPAMDVDAVVEHMLGYKWDELKTLKQQIKKRKIKESDEHVRLLILYMLQKRFKKVLIDAVADGEKRYLTD